MKIRIAAGRLGAVMFFLISSGASLGGDNGSDPKTLQVTVQSCDDEGEAFLFNAEARAQFDSCGAPLVGFDVTLLSLVRGVLVRGVSDDNGETALGQVEVGEEEPLSLAVCSDDFCIHIDRISIAQGHLQEGKNFVLHRNGSGND